MHKKCIVFMQKLQFKFAAIKFRAFLKNLRVSQWWYEYSRAYGSPKIGERESELSSVSLEKDCKTLLIKMSLQKKQVYCLDLSQVLNLQGHAVHNAKAFYTLINLIE